MEFTKGAVALFASVTLAACGTNGPDPSGSDAGSKTSYQCDDGSIVEASYPTKDTAEVVIKGQPIAMTSAVSASGARYVGGGWEWWTKGTTEGMLSPLAEGESIASTGGVNCTAG